MRVFPTITATTTTYKSMLINQEHLPIFTDKTRRSCWEQRNRYERQMIRNFTAGKSLKINLVWHGLSNCCLFVVFFFPFPDFLPLTLLPSCFIPVPSTNTHCSAGIHHNASLIPILSFFYLLGLVEKKKACASAYQSHIYARERKAAVSKWKSNCFYK